MNRKVISRMLMMAGIVVAFAAGQKMARSSGGTRDRDDGPRKDDIAGFVAGLQDRSLTGEVAAARSSDEVKARMMNRWEASPAPLVDFELRDETMRLLEKTPVADLERWMRELHSLGQTDYDKDVPRLLREMILKVMARRGGGAVIQSLAATTAEDGVGDVEDAMDHWLKHDPVAVLDWLDGEVPEMIADYLDVYREEALERLAGKDPVAFEQRLSEVDSELREEVLEDYAWARGSAEGRNGLFERAAGSPRGEAMALWSGLLRREGEEEPARAYATLGELDISAEDRAELDERLMFWLLYASPFSESKIDGAGIMRAWATRNPGDAASESILESFGRWSGSDPDQAAVWVAELPSGDRYDVFAKALIEKRIGEHETAAGIVARIGDADLRHAMQRRLKASWQEKNAEKVVEWEKALPEEERERLK